MSAAVIGNALAFARRGYAVLPLCWPVPFDGGLICSCKKRRGCPSPAKHPHGALAPNGLLSATTESGIIKHWFGYQAPDANYGVRTDGALFVLDVDPKRDGDEALAALEREHGPLPATWRTVTGSTGEHILFDAEGLDLRRFAYNPKAVELSQPLGVGIDAPNYIVGPGSRHVSGRCYAWNVDCHPAKTPLAKPPDWLIEASTVSARDDGDAATAGHDPVVWAAAHAGMVTEYRDLAVAQVAGKLLRAVSIHPAFAQTLLHSWNETHCAPPLSRGEVIKIFDRIAEREIARLESADAS